MRIEPRQQIFEAWKALLQYSVPGPDRTWVWGGRDGSNSISDAEQLLCLLYPATEIESLALDRPDATADDVADVLARLGSPAQIPRAIVGILESYVARHTRDGQPVFHAGDYLRAARDPDAAAAAGLTDSQRELDVLDAYSMSVTLCLAAKGFLTVYRGSGKTPRSLEQRIDELQLAIGRRLTAALVGMLRSFVVNTVEPSDPAAAVMLKTVNQDNLPDDLIRDRLRDRLVRIRARLRDDVRLGVPADDLSLEDEDQLFECGWSWGIVETAVPITLEGDGTGDASVSGLQIAQRKGTADARPYLYFTVVALDGINDLLSARTRELSLLDDEQRRLAEALQLRADLTQRYWSTIARFGANRWPLEDIPWRTSDNEESDYFSLLVSAVLVQDLVARTATDDDLTRAVTVFEELARRGRITRRLKKTDPALALHVPGQVMPLIGSEEAGGSRLYWQVADFAPLLMKRCLQSARLSGNVAARDRLMSLAQAVMDHLDSRRLHSGPAMRLWDDPADVFFPDQDGPHEQQPSWYLTERIIEGLVAAANTYLAPPLRSQDVVAFALDMLNEADHLLNQSLLGSNAHDQSEMRISMTRIERRLDRARRIVLAQPATAVALVTDALTQLDDISEAQSDTSTGGR